MRGRGAVAMVAILLVSSTCFGWNPLKRGAKKLWAAPYNEKNTVGAALEVEFQNLLKSCQAFVLHSVGDQYSAVPPALQRDADIKTKIASTYNGESTYELFRYIFEEKGGRPEKLPSTWDPTRLLSDGLFPRSDLPKPEPGSGSTIHSQSCSAVLDAAVRARIKLPLSALEGALATEYQSHYELALVKGTFYSPLWALLSGTGEPAKRTAALLTIWKAFRDDPKLVGGQNVYYYLRGFRGVAVYQISREARRTRGSSKLSVGGNWVLASLDASAQGTYSAEADSRLIDYKTFVLKIEAGVGEDPVDAVSYEKLPHWRDIKAAVRLLRPVYGAERQTITASAPHVHWVEAEGIPPALCVSSEWDIQTSDKRDGLSFTAATKLPGDRCRFQASYETKPSTPETGTLEYVLVGAAIKNSEGKIIDADGESAQLELPVSFHLVKEDLPRFELGDVRRAAEVSTAGGLTKLVWSIDLMLMDDAKKPLVDSARKTWAASPTITCPSEPATPQSAALVDPPVGTPWTHRLVLRGQVPAGQQVSDKIQPKECSVTVTLNIPTAVGGNKAWPVVAPISVPVLSDSGASPQP